MFICLSPQIISANSSNFPGQTQLSNAVSRDYADYRNDKDFLFSFFFLDLNVLKKRCRTKILFCLLTKKKPRSWITFESISPPHCSALDASVQHISLHFASNACDNLYFWNQRSVYITVNMQHATEFFPPLSNYNHCKCS